MLQLAYQTQSAFSSYVFEDDGFISAKSAPVVVVFTKYDLLVKTKRVKLQRGNKGLDSVVLNKQSEEEAQKVLDICVQSLEEAMSRLKTQMPRYVHISSIFFSFLFWLGADLFVVFQGYEADISSLVEVTRDVVQEKLMGDAWVMWAIAQRASLSVKIEACAA